MLLLVYSIVVTVSWVIVTIYLLLNSRKIIYLKNVPGTLQFQPSVDIIIAVRNEEAEVEAALTSVCNLDYNNYQIIVVNDRSTDSTADILNVIARSNPAVKIITINNLPGGWLGKNHALYQGYLSSSADWLLFTDADVMYDRDALKKAMQYASERRLEHLTALPEITSKSTLFKSVVNTFAIMLELNLRPWNASDPTSRASIGIGAFNLVKRTAYEKSGTHVSISLRPDDDLKLGQRIKQAGLRQDVVYGEKEISLQWYSNLGEFINGLMKNTFSVSNYNLFLAIATAIGTFLAFVAPLPLVLLQEQYGLFMALTIIVAQALLMHYKKGVHGKWWQAFVIPFAGVVMSYIIAKSAIKTIKQGGIYWRDSFYKLEELKKQR